MSARTIMLIEDEKKMSKLYGVVLETKGYTVISVDSVDEALTSLESALPDVIISDIMMPVTNGIDGCKQIRERHGRDVPLMFVSALDDRKTVLEAFDAGGDDYLTKQSSLEDVMNRVELWMETPPQQRIELAEKSRAAWD
jgi:DNA-binding response OmpR family regulator